MLQLFWLQVHMKIFQHLVTLELRQLLGMSTSRAAATARGKGAQGQVIQQKHSWLQQQQQRLFGCTWAATRQMESLLSYYGSRVANIMTHRKECQHAVAVVIVSMMQCANSPLCLESSFLQAIYVCCFLLKDPGAAEKAHVMLMICCKFMGGNLCRR
jgi:hypothetical protein